MTVHSAPPEPRGGTDRPAAPPTGTPSTRMTRELALEAAARVTGALPAPMLQDPDSAARRTISIAVIFESYLQYGAESTRGQ